MGKALSIFKRRRYPDNDSALGGSSGRLKRNIFTDFSDHKICSDGDTQFEDGTKTFNEFSNNGRTCVNIADDSKFIISGDRSNSVIVQSCEDLQIRHKLTEHTRDVIKISSFQKHFVSGSRDATIAVWEIGQDNCVGKLTDHQLAVTAIDFDHRHGNELVSGSRDNTVKFWDMETFECISSITESRNLVTDMKWNCETNIIAQTSEDKSVKLWDSRMHEIVHTLPTQQQIPTCCDVSGNHCITGYNGFLGEGCQLFLWDIRALNFISQYLGHQETVTSCAFLPNTNSQEFVSSSNDGSVRVWNKDLTSSVLHENIQSGPLTAVQAVDRHNLIITSLNDGVKKLALPSTS